MPRDQNSRFPKRVCKINKRVGVQGLDPSEHAQLYKLAKLRGLSISAIVCTLIRRELDTAGELQRAGAG